jgi:hypothetical protein
MEFKKIVAWLENPVDYGMIVMLWVVLMLMLVWLFRGGT